MTAFVRIGFRQDRVFSAPNRYPNVIKQENHISNPSSLYQNQNCVKMSTMYVDIQPLCSHQCDVDFFAQNIFRSEISMMVAKVYIPVLFPLTFLSVRRCWSDQWLQLPDCLQHRLILSSPEPHLSPVVYCGCGLMNSLSRLGEGSPLLRLEELWNSWRLASTLILEIHLVWKLLDFWLWDLR